MQDKRENEPARNTANNQAAVAETQQASAGTEQEQTATEQDAALEQQRKEAMTERD